jgi:hypothetical protein
MLSDNIMLSDNMLSYFFLTSHTPNFAQMGTAYCHEENNHTTDATKKIILPQIATVLSLNSNLDCQRVIPVVAKPGKP